MTRARIQLEHVTGTGLTCQGCNPDFRFPELWRLTLGPVAVELCSACTITLRSVLNRETGAPRVRPNVNAEDARRKGRPHRPRKATEPQP